MEFEWLNSRIADETVELVFLFNEEGSILYGNQAAAAKLEYEGDKLEKCSMSQIFRKDFPNSPDGFITFVKKSMKGVNEMTMYRSNNSCFSVNVRIFPEDKADAYLLLAEDISAQKSMNMRIRELKEKEDENNRARNEFTANVTHELRTPVNGIKGHALELLEEIEDPVQKKTLDIIVSCCDNMSTIINDVLDFAKLESGKFVIDERPFDFREMMDKVIATHSAAVNKKELHMSVDIDEKIPEKLIGDDLRLTQVLNNLLSNAIKFTTVGYVNVVVGMTRRVNDEVELFFMVRDSGIGISQKEQDRLFQSFSQVDASITRRFGGTGLGLAITKQLVELMHGDIHVESEKGKGSAFSFSVKLKSEQVVEGAQNQVLVNWAEYVKESENQNVDRLMQFGEEENREELKKRMDKLVLSIEMGAWDKAELLASTLKALIESSGDDDLKRNVLRMEMAIRKSNYDRSVDAYGKLKDAITERVGDIWGAE
ncbi:MAG: ATP-binding protein [Bacteroidales bacterium]|nr:ATP-binding protein [Bacteroidales bacterium]MCM1415049.1 ATP-binding protein [bacterium]MCM1422903.1 ATP-binding protein [bacterium]